MASKKPTVHVRLRPGPNPVVQQTSQTCVTATPPPTYTISKDPVKFSFDSIFNQDASQEDVFQSIMGVPLANIFTQPENVLVFAYGVTSSGKTHTIQGSSESPGLLPRVADHLLTALQSDPMLRPQFVLKFGMLEIYNGTLCDLFVPAKSTGPVIEHSATQGQVLNQKFSTIESMYSFQQHFNTGIRRRKVSATDLNEQSSRSHCQYVLKIVDVASERVFSTISIFDLAGAERTAKTGGVRDAVVQAETSKINLSLSALQDLLKGGNRWREDILTCIIRDYFASPSKMHIHMITCINPSPVTYDETIRSLQWAAKSSQTIHTTTVNSSALTVDTISRAEHEKVLHENHHLHQRLATLERQLKSVNSSISSTPSKSLATKDKTFSYDSLDLDIEQLYLKNEPFQQLCLELWHKQQTDQAQEKTQILFQQLAKIRGFTELFNMCVEHDPNVGETVDLIQALHRYEKSVRELHDMDELNLDQLVDIAESGDEGEDDEEDDDIVVCPKIPLPPEYIPNFDLDSFETLREKVLYKKSLDFMKRVYCVLKQSIVDEVSAEFEEKQVELSSTVVDYENRFNAFIKHTEDIVKNRDLFYEKYRTLRSKFKEFAAATAEMEAHVVITRNVLRSEMNNFVDFVDKYKARTYGEVDQQAKEIEAHNENVISLGLAYNTAINHLEATHAELMEYKKSIEVKQNAQEATSKRETRSYNNDSDDIFDEEQPVSKITKKTPKKTVNKKCTQDHDSNCSKMVDISEDEMLLETKPKRVTTKRTKKDENDDEEEKVIENVPKTRGRLKKEEQQTSVKTRSNSRVRKQTVETFAPATPANTGRKPAPAPPSSSTKRTLTPTNDENIPTTGTKRPKSRPPAGNDDDEEIVSIQTPQRFHRKPPAPPSEIMTRSRRQL